VDLAKLSYRGSGELTHEGVAEAYEEAARIALMNVGIRSVQIAQCPLHPVRLLFKDKPLM
jgi:hypothetical protein